MNWLNIELTVLRSEEYLGSEPVQRATWINLLAYCADQENGGVIKSCSDWGSRRWLQLLGVTKEEVYSDTKLWEFKADDLHVFSYPKDQEIALKAKRNAGKKGGRPPKTKAKKPHGLGNEKPYGSVLLKRKGIVKERNSNSKGKEVPPKSPKGEYTEEFLQFWGSYPKKIGKGDAFKSWNRINDRPSILDLMKSLAWQKETDQWKRDGGQYIPMMATWLNQRRWEDERFDSNSVAQSEGVFL